MHWVAFPIKNLSWAIETTKRILTMEKLDGHLAGQSTGSPSFLTMNEENKQRPKMVVFNESDITGAKFYKLTLC